MARGAAVKQEEQQGSAGEPKASKRRCVQSACVPCRKRKSKCDGGTPVCATCTAVYKTQCFYDQESENRRTKGAGLKRDSSVVSTPQPPFNDHADFLINTIRTLPDSEASELVQQIRRDGPFDMAALAETWSKATTLLPASTLDPSLEADLSMFLGKPAMTASGESRYFGHTSGMSLVPEDENYSRARMRASSVEPKPRTWTQVTDDLNFVERLFDLYFRWSHPFYVIFSRECFYKDFRLGREKYCSPLLVNAILAYACHFSDEPHAKTIPDNPRTAGDHFFDEARRLLFEDESPSLTTTQALCVMAMREPSAGRDSSGFMYMGRCMRMAIELGLHLKNSAAPAMQLTPSEVEVRKVTFWGCFTVDTVWSICVGRLSQLPRAAITLEKPILEEAPSGLRPDAYPGASTVPPGTVTTRVFLQAFSSLSELVNDNIYMFYAPKERFTSRRFLECYSKYQKWYEDLPQALQIEDVSDVRDAQPHIIVLHMLYYSTLSHLFRPMLKVEIIDSNVRPRDKCMETANKVSELLRLYRQHFDMRACQLVLTHILLSACIVHLLFSKDSQTNYIYLVEGLRALEDMSVCHYFGARSFKIVYSLSKVWNLRFPEELQNSKLVRSEDATGIMSPPAESLVVPQPTRKIPSNVSGGAGFGLMAPTPQGDRRQSLSMFSRPEHKVMQLASHPAPSHGSPSPANQAQHRGSNPNIVPLYPATSSSTPPQPLPTTNPSISTTSAADSLFWTPIPSMGVPILHRNYQMSPMDMEHMMGGSDEWDGLTRDGFKISESWAQDPVNAFHGGSNEGYAQGSGETTGYHSNPAGGQYGSGGEMSQQVPAPGGEQNYDPRWWSGEGGHGQMR